MSRAIAMIPVDLPVPQPELPDCPTFVLTCDRCGATTSWLVPHKNFRGIVRELAERAGWVGAGVVAKETICPGCRPKPQIVVPAKVRSKPYGEALLVRMHRMRREGVSTMSIAAHASAALGRTITRVNVNSLFCYYRNRPKPWTRVG